MGRRILIYCQGIDDLLDGSLNVAGIQVQMCFWARIFISRGWDVFTYTTGHSRQMEGIHFVQKKQTFLDRAGFSLIQEIFDSLSFVRRERPDVIFARGAQRTLFGLRICHRLYHSRVVFMSASDTDCVPGHELIAGSGINARMYRHALRGLDLIVTQNQFQSDNLLKNYNISSFILGNVWLTGTAQHCKETKYDAVWIANLRRLKRAEWFLELAVAFPDLKFAIIGGANEQDYYDEIYERSANVANLNFVGALPFEEVNEMIAKSRILVCTSEFEGFPNTFLQAWANDLPVISTVDPSGVIKRYTLGFCVHDKTELFEKMQTLSANQTVYSDCQEHIRCYFAEHYNVGMAYDRIMEKLSL